MVDFGSGIKEKYVILEKIREGGMGAVYKVHHRLLDEVRVVKVMKPDVVASQEMRQRFLDEARTASRLKHPNIATIYDFAADEHGTYLVMEFIDGVNLRDLLKANGPPDISLTLEMILQALSALGFLHRKNFVHRDVAPDNLMLSTDEEGHSRIKLIDLGIAKALDSEQGLTIAGSFLGKLSYASPEQFGALGAGEKIDGRSDLYSLGIVFYELLTGQRPFQAQPSSLIPHKHLTGEYVPFEETDPANRVPADVRAAVLKAMARRREDRWASAEEMARELRRLKQLHASGVEETPSDLMTIARAQEPTHPTGGYSVTPGLQSDINRRFATETGVTPPASTTTSAPTSAPAPSPPADDSDGETYHAAAAAASPAPRPAEPVVPPASPSRAVADPGSAAPRPVERPRPSVPRPTAAATAPEKGPGKMIAIVGACVAIAVAGFLFTRKKPEPASLPETATPASSVEPEAAASTAPAAAPDAPRTGPAAPPAAPVRIQVSATAAPPSGEPLTVEIPAGAIEVAGADATGAAAPPEAAAAPPTPLATSSVTSAAIVEEPAIRETLDEYMRGLSTLDVGLVERAYPATAEKRKDMLAAFAELDAQDVEIEVGTIDVNGTSAVVKAGEKSSTTTKGGETKKSSRRVTIGMEKRQNGWVIVSLR